MPPVTAPPSVIASFEGGWIRLADGWGEAQACAYDGVDARCYRSEAEMDEAEQPDVNDALARAECPLPTLKLYRSASYGGNVNISSPGNSGGIDLTGEIRTTGGDGYAGDGGKGGNVSLSTGKALAANDMITTAGGGGYGSGKGGAGGSISLSAGATGMSFTTLDASGGESDTATGGTGGNIGLSTSGGGAVSGSTVNAYGGYGVGTGGTGGTVTISSGPLTLEDGVYTNGGDSSLGSGGSAGAVTITTNGAVSVSAIGAYGGTGYGGAGGDGAAVSISSAWKR